MLSRMLPWLGVPVSLAVFATSALADSVVTKRGDVVEGTILSESQLGVTIVDAAGLPHTFFHDELASIHVDGASDPNVATGAVRSLAERAARDQDADISAEAARELSERQHRPFFGHEVTGSLWGTSLGIFVPAAYANYRLLIGDYLAAYVGAGGGMALSPHKVPVLQDDGTQASDANGNPLTKNVTTSFLDLPFGLQLRLGGAYLGGGASYLMPKGVGDLGAALKSQVIPNVVAGYEYQFPDVFGYTYRRPATPGHFSAAPHGLSLGMGVRYGLGATSFYGGTLYAGWSF